MPPRKSHPPVDQSPGERHTALVLLVLASVVGYLLAFYATGLPSLAARVGKSISRAELFLKLLLQFDQVAANWLGAPGELSLLDRLPVVAIALVVILWAAAAGWLALLLFRVDRALARLESFVFSTTVGLNVLSTYVLVVGLLGTLRCRLVFVVPMLLTLFTAAWLLWRRKTIFPAKKLLVTTSAELGGQSPPGSCDHDWPGRRWLWLAVPFAAAILLGGMLPPVEFDVREYHLQVPKEFYQQGFVGFLPHNVYGNMPLGAEMLSLLAMALAGDWWLGALAGKTVIAVFAPLTALGLYAAGRRLHSPGAGLVAAIVYISIPWIAQVSSLGLVDGAVACYLFLALYALLLVGNRLEKVERVEKGVRTIFGGENSSAPFFLLAGYLAGGAVSCKYPALLFVVIPLATWTLLAGGLRNVFSRTRLVSLSLFLLAVAAGCGLWFGKNWVMTGNPTYPLLDEVFDSAYWSAEQNQQWNNVHRPHDFSPHALAKDIGRVTLTSEWLSPLVMPLAFLALLAPTRRRLSLVLVAYFSFIILTWWLLTHRIDRFWIPALPLAALLAGLGSCWSRSRIWRGALVGLLVLGSIYNLLVITSVAGGYTAYFVSLEHLRKDPLRLDPWHRYFNEHPPQGRLLLVGDAAVFDLEVPVVYSTCFDDSLFERLVKGHTPEQIRAALAAEDISHIYVNWAEIARYRSPGNYGFTDFVCPEVFSRLVEQNVLEPLSDIKGHPGRAYRVSDELRLKKGSVKKGSELFFSLPSGRDLDKLLPCLAPCGPLPTDWCTT